MRLSRRGTAAKTVGLRIDVSGSAMLRIRRAAMEWETRAIAAEEADFGAQVGDSLDDHALVLDKGVCKRVHENRKPESHQSHYAMLTICANGSYIRQRTHPTIST